MRCAVALDRFLVRDSCPIFARCCRGIAFSRCSRSSSFEPVTLRAMRAAAAVTVRSLTLLSVNAVFR